MRSSLPAVAIATFALRNWLPEPDSYDQYGLGKNSVEIRRHDFLHISVPYKKLQAIAHQEQYSIDQGRRKVMRFTRAIIGLLATGLFMAVPAHAAPVTWTVQSATFSDGGYLYGSFKYDADTNAYSNIALYAVTLPTTPLPLGASAGTQYYSALNMSQPAGPNFFTTNNTTLGGTCPVIGMCALKLNFGLLTNAGGYSSLSGIETVSPPYSLSRTFTSGTLSAAAAVVPIPAALWLFGSGLGLLGWVRKRRYL